MKINGYLIHCCMFSPGCLWDFWKYGMPLRLHLGDRFWTLFSGTKRYKKVWNQNLYYKRDLETNQWFKHERADENSKWSIIPCNDPLGLKSQEKPPKSG